MEENKKFRKVSKEILVEVMPSFDEVHSAPNQAKFVFQYAITIHNLGEAKWQLMRRQWCITDANGKIMLVQGEGVVGEQPVIYPLSYFQYSSSVRLETEVGTMEGVYEMLKLDGSASLVPIPIPMFSLEVPGVMN